MKAKSASFFRLYNIVLPNPKLLLLLAGFIYVGLLYVFIISILLYHTNFITYGFFSNQLFFSLVCCGVAACMCFFSGKVYPRLAFSLILFFLVNAVALPYSSRYLMDTLTPSEKTLKQQAKDWFVFNVNTTEPLVALTFDDGPVPGKTEAILDVLKKENVHATFFVLGKSLEHKEGADIIRRAHAEGHEIGNHTYSHCLTRITPPAKADLEYMETSRLIKEVTGEAPKYCRPPTGRTNMFYVRRMNEKYGMKPVYWTNSTEDWANSNDDSCYDNVMRQMPYGGAIFLHHDFSSSPRLIERIIHDLKKRGYRFVTISEMLQQQAGQTISRP